MTRHRAALAVVLAGVSAALHLGKLPVAGRYIAVCVFSLRGGMVPAALIVMAVRTSALLGEAAYSFSSSTDNPPWRRRFLVRFRLGQPWAS